MKRYLVSAKEMKCYDNNTIMHFKIPGAVLMERAALASVETIKREHGKEFNKVLIVAGGGNNGGDGFAIGRLLMLEGYDVDFVLLAKEEKLSDEMRHQIEILHAYGSSYNNRIEDKEYDIVIDAIFGIGLTRNVEGAYKEAIDTINNMESYICSIDMPSGIHSDDGRVMGSAVKADVTVTFAFEKIGQYLFPGCSYCGKLVCCDIGINAHSFYGKEPLWFHYEKETDMELPRRRADGNKGTFGKVLVIAGNKDIYGACYFAAKAAFTSGAGMVKIITHEVNRIALQEKLPEAMLCCYTSKMTKKQEEEFALQLRNAFAWADCILIGPGIGTEKEADSLVSRCVFNTELPVVMDADAISILAKNGSLKEALAQQGKSGRCIVLTPHVGEFSRLYGCKTAEVKDNLTKYPVEMADKIGAVMVCKDARTIVTNGKERYLNSSGNSGMASAGTGDVLAGMIAGMIAGDATGSKDRLQTVAASVFLHGMAGDKAADKHSEHAMTAMDLLNELPALFQRME